jgi:hypothetical protein
VDALDVLKVWLRRWYVVIPIVLLSLAAALGLAHQQKPTYTAFGGYALVYHSPPHLKEGVVPTEANPLAANGAVVLGEALAADFMSGVSQTTFGGVGNRGTAPRDPEDGTSYSVGQPDGSQSYVVQTWGHDPESLRKVVDSVLADAPGRAALIQDRAGAPKESQYTTFVTGSTRLTKLPPTSPLKLVLALLGVGILVGSALSLLVDHLVRSRKGRAAAGASQVAGWWDTDMSLTTEGSDSPGILRMPPHENEAEPLKADKVKLPSDGAASLDAAEASEDIVRQMHQVEAEERPLLGAEELVAVDAAEVPAVEAEAVSTTEAAEVSAVEAAESPAVDAEERPPSGAQEAPTTGSSEVPAVAAEVVPTTAAATVPEPKDAAEIPVFVADEVRKHESGVFSEDWALSEFGIDWADIAPDAGGGEEVYSTAAEEQLQIDLAHVEQRHELETKPLTEYPVEPDSDHMDSESESDDDSWPLLQRKQEFGEGEFEADDVDNQTQLLQRKQEFGEGEFEADDVDNQTQLLQPKQKFGEGEFEADDADNQTRTWQRTP